MVGVAVGYTAVYKRPIIELATSPPDGRQDSSSSDAVSQRVEEEWGAGLMTGVWLMVRGRAYGSVWLVVGVGLTVWMWLVSGVGLREWSGAFNSLHLVTKGQILFWIWSDLVKSQDLFNDWLIDWLIWYIDVIPRLSCHNNQQKGGYKPSKGIRCNSDGPVSCIFHVVLTLSCH